MCGISGWLPDWSNLPSQDDLTAKVSQMSQAIFHRGPDNGGLWIDPEQKIGLGHRRLAIIDLSLGGHQPMHSKSGRFKISFNGEIYNFRALKEELTVSGIKFNSNSDTEVLIEGIEHWGLEQTLKKVNGMFAFALWDEKERSLSLVRDRIGEKPLYYGKFESGWYFSSEIKSFHSAGLNLSRLQKSAIQSLFNLGYIAGSQTIYQNVHKLRPGQILTISHKGSSELHSYWSARQAFQENYGSRQNLGLAQLKTEFRDLLFDATRIRLESDVPVGAFLSGGIDSSLVVSAMKNVSTGPISTFTVGFPNWENNESKYASKVAKHLGTKHYELQVRDQDLLDVIPQLPAVYDEPFADASQIPTILISKLTRKHVTVCLSGDGGDEVFWGYPRYWNWRKTWQLVSKTPTAFRHLSNHLSLVIPPGCRRVAKLASMLGAENEVSFYQKAYAHWLRSIVIEGEDFKFGDFSPPKAKPEEIWQLIDTEYYLPDDILVKVDRAGMAVALENRIPFLDHRIVEFGWSLPEKAKYFQRQSKFLMRQLLYDYIPQSLIDRPKQGFGVPMGTWLRGPLREWAETLLNQRALEESQLLHTHMISWHWKTHLEGQKDYSGLLWSVLMFQSWFRKYQVSYEP